jgi:predicted CopG family antitoxin
VPRRADPPLDPAGSSVHAKGMAVKTITIDLEAYEILSRHKRAGESFSDVIKARLGRRVTGRDLRALIARATIAPETLDAIDARVRARRRHPARAATL